MKHLFALIILMGLALLSTAQDSGKRKSQITLIPISGARYNYQIQDSNSLIVLWYRGSDTLNIGDKIKYIKVGNSVFQIVKHECTIEPAPPVFQLGGTLYGPQSNIWPPNGTSISPQ